ncbi:MAG: PIN domain-containing protein, partial [Propionibacteriaceae bacterium]|nr:PIN domain-containing protein [Propionibacteriaceae bacterium]
PQVFQEVLQGARDERNFARLQTYLSTQRMLSLPQTAEACVKAARLFFDLRRKGVTVRGSADVLIALTAIENDAALLAEDRDFENIAAHEPRLRLA